MKIALIPICALLTLWPLSIAIPAETGGLVINEAMSLNASTWPDEMGEFDDWIEIMNTGLDPVDLTGIALTDDLAVLDAYVFPTLVLAPGERTVVWADGSVLQGPAHAPFRLDATSDTIYLLDGDVVLDMLTFTSPGEDRSYGRWPDGGETFRPFGVATPAAANHVPAPTGAAVVINELMAENDTTIEDSESPGAYPDWFELFNPGGATVDLSGLFLTDDLDQPLMYRIPEGTTLGPGAHLVFWADADAEQGPLHTSFKLGNGGDAIGLFDRDGTTMIDSVTFVRQEPDRSLARNGDGATLWHTPLAPTPGAANEAADYAIQRAAVKHNVKKPDRDRVKMIVTYPTASVDPTEHGIVVRLLGETFTLPPESFVALKKKYVGRSQGVLKSVVLLRKTAKLVITIKRADLGGPREDPGLALEVECGPHLFTDAVTTVLKNNGLVMQYKAAR